MELVKEGTSLVMYDVLKETYRNRDLLRSSFRKLARELEGRVRFVWIDIYEYPEVSDDVRYVPTFRVFQNGKPVVDWDCYTKPKELGPLVNSILAQPKSDS
jgi:thioredoxin-like negative regulator of GroEL